MIEISEFSQVSIKDCMNQVREYLEERVPKLRDGALDPAIVQELKSRAAQIGYTPEQDAPEESGFDEDGEGLGASSNDDPTGVLFEESHIFEFWQEVAARDEVIKQIDSPIDDEEFLGFT